MRNAWRRPPPGRPALHRHAGGERDHVQPRRADAGVRPVDEPGALSRQQDVVRAHVVVQERIARQRVGDGVLDRHQRIQMASRPFVHPVEPGRPFVAERRQLRSPRKRSPAMPTTDAGSGDGVSVSASSSIAATTRSSSSGRHGWVGWRPSTSSKRRRTQPLVVFVVGAPARPWIPAFAVLTRLFAGTTVLFWSLVVGQGSLVVGPEQARRRRGIGQAGRYADLAPVDRRRVGVGFGADGLGEDAAAVGRGQPRRYSGREAGGLRYGADYFAAEPAFDLAPDAPGEVRPVQSGAAVRGSLSLLHCTPSSAAATGGTSPAGRSRRTCAWRARPRSTRGRRARSTSAGGPR